MAKKQSYLKRKQSFSGAQVLLFVLIFAAVGAVAIWQSLAAPAKGGKPSGGTTTISLNLPPFTDVNGDGLPNHGDVVNFTVTTSASNPYVDMQCFQNGVLVAEGWRGYFPGSLDWPNGTFGLTAPPWASGAADCTAYVKTYTGHGKNPWITLASTSFHVYA